MYSSGSKRSQRIGFMLFNFISTAIIVVTFLLPVGAQRRAESVKLSADRTGEKSADSQAVPVYPIAHFPMGIMAGERINSPQAVDPTSVYSNVTTFLGSALANGGAATDPADAGNTITRLQAEDLQLLNTVGAPPYTITGYKIAVSNLNAGAVLVRFRTRFWLADGPGGGPGTLITFISLTPNAAVPPGVTIFTTGDLAGLQFAVPSRNIWAGISFDSGGATAPTGATAAQLNNFGVGFFDPPDRGTSTDTAFLTTANGAFGASNPAGAQFNTAGIVDNFGWELVTASIPTASNVQIGGRVLSSDGRGIGNALLTLTGPDGASISVITGKRGDYHFDDVAAGRTYILSVSSRRYSFDTPTQVISVTDNIADMNFVATP